MPKRKLGNSNLEVSAFGLGCMKMGHDENPIPDKQEMISFLHAFKGEPIRPTIG